MLGKSQPTGRTISPLPREFPLPLLRGTHSDGSARAGREDPIGEGIPQDFRESVGLSVALGRGDGKLCSARYDYGRTTGTDRREQCMDSRGERGDGQGARRARGSGG